MAEAYGIVEVEIARIEIFAKKILWRPFDRKICQFEPILSLISADLTTLKNYTYVTGFDALNNHSNLSND